MRPAHAVLLGLVTTVASAAGCHACTDEIVAGPKVDGPVKAEFKIFKEAWGKISRSAPVRYGFLEIEAKERIEYRTKCWSQERYLAGAPDGIRFAYRCDATSKWEVVFAGSHGRAWEACESDAGSGATPDWSKVPEQAAAWPELVRCVMYDADVLFADLAADGPAAIGPVLAATAGLRIGRTKTRPDDAELKLGEDAWLRARAKADDAAKKLADDALRAGIVKKGADLEPNATPGTLLHRALLVLPHGDISAEMLLTRTEEIAMQPKRSWADDRALARATRMLVATKPKEMGELACRALLHPFTDDGDNWSLAPDHMTLALAATRTPCPELVKRLGCERYGCGEGDAEAMCTREQLDALLADELKKDPFTAGGTGSDIGSSRALLLVGRQSGGIPEGFDRRSARLHYAVEDGISCGLVTERDVKCRALTDAYNVSLVMCDVDPKVTEVKRFHSRITIDDAKRTLSARQMCDDEESCFLEIDCCPGKTCQDMRCRVPGAPSASAAPAGGAAPAGSTTPSGSAAPAGGAAPKGSAATSP